jgi:hypothetical protein
MDQKINVVQVNELSFYVIGKKETSACKNDTYKIGYHKGSEAKLIKRYATSIPDLEIVYFSSMPRAKHFEKMLLILFDHVRVINPNQNKSEWIQCPKEKLLVYIKQFEQIFKEVVDVGTETHVEIRPRKKKRTFKATNETLTTAQEVKSNDLGDSIYAHIGNDHTPEAGTNPMVISQLQKRTIKNDRMTSIMQQEFLSYLRNIRELENCDEHFLRKLIQLLSNEIEYAITLKDIVDWIYNYSLTGDAYKNACNILRNEYRFQLDYLEGNKMKTGNRGPRSQQYHLSNVAAHDLILRLPGPRAKTIRNYYNAIRKIHQDWLMDSISKRIHSEEK